MISEFTKIRRIKLNNSKYFLALLFVVLFAPLTLKANFSANASAQMSDSMEVLKNYSLFFEFHKNGDYTSAVPYGWEVIKLNPSRFKNVYSKMEDALWYLHDSTEVSEDEKNAIADTTLYLYDVAIQNVPNQAGFYHARKAFVMESWLQNPNRDSVISEYEQAAKLDTSLATFYSDRLGLQYVAKMEQDESFQLKAFELYSALSDKEPNNQLWQQRLEALAGGDLTKLMEILYKGWNMDKENTQKAWKFASVAIKSREYERAIEPLEFLVSKDPSVLNYWNQLATAYEKTERSDKAIDAYKKVISLEPQNRDAYLNLGILYKNKNQLAQARTYFNRALEVSPGWGYPVYLEGTLYEQAARNCGFEFEDRLVYQLAVDTYRRARSMDQSISSQAQERINALSSSVPTKEDYFFRKIKSGQNVPIEGSCYGWIGKSVTAP